MNIRKTLVYLCLLLPALAAAAEPGGNWLQLQRLDQESRQDLQRIQRPPAGIPAAPTPLLADPRDALNRRQRQQQIYLQESQQRRLGEQNRQNRVLAPDGQEGFRSNVLQQRFRQEQQNQLQRFNTQQLMRIPPRY